jgi:hypothetical protein
MQNITQHETHFFPIKIIINKLLDVFHSQFIKFALLFIYLIIDRLIKNVLIY